MNAFAFKSYGVEVLIESNSRELLDKAVSVAKKSLLGRLREIDPEHAKHFIRLDATGDLMSLHFDGDNDGETESEFVLFNFFDTRIRLLIGEYSKELVFVHAGAVAWKGRAIILPGDSFAGKSTLVTELIRYGAEYLSDEYAVFDSEGLVHAFPRAISMRSSRNPVDRWHVPYEDLNAVIPLRPIQTGLVLFTQYRKHARWRPQPISPGNAVLLMIPQAISIRVNTDFTLNVLNNVASRAILLESLRGEARSAARNVIDFVDKMVI